MANSQLRTECHRLSIRPIREGEPGEKKCSAIAFLKKAVAYYDSLGVTVDRVMTDKHVRTKPYTPKTILRFHS